MTEQAVIVVAAYVRAHAAEAARVLEARPTEELVAFLNSVSGELGAVLLATMEVNAAARALERIDPPHAAVVLAGLAPERAAALVRGMQDRPREQALCAMNGKQRERIERLLSFREHTVGTRMKSRVLTLRPEATAAEAIALVRAAPERASKYLYAVDQRRRLVGVVSLKELLAGAEAAGVASLMERRVISLRTRDSLSSVLVNPSWARYRMLPVVDERGQFAGVFRHPGPGGPGAGAQMTGNPAGQASEALGDLYRIGLTALFNSAMGGTAPPSSATQRRPGSTANDTADIMAIADIDQAGSDV